MLVVVKQIMSMCKIEKSHSSMGTIEKRRSFRRLSFMNSVFSSTLQCGHHGLPIKIRIWSRWCRPVHSEGQGRRIVNSRSTQATYKILSPYQKQKGGW